MKKPSQKAKSPFRLADIEDPKQRREYVKEEFDKAINKLYGILLMMRGEGLEISVVVKSRKSKDSESDNGRTRWVKRGK